MVRKLPVALCLSFCLLGSLSCVLVRTDTKREIFEKKPVGPPDRYAKESLYWELRFVRQSGADLLFDLTRVTTTRNFSRQTYDLSGQETESMARDKDGRFRFFFFGPAWVVGDSGAGNYAKTLAVSTCMSLGGGLIVAFFDWLSLPFRLGTSDFQERKDESREIKRDVKRAPEGDVADLELLKQPYPVRRGQVAIPREKFFYRRHGYPHGQIRFELRAPGEERSVARFQRMQTIFSRADYERVVPPK